MIINIYSSVIVKPLSFTDVYVSKLSHAYHHWLFSFSCPFCHLNCEILLSHFNNYNKNMICNQAIFSLDLTIMRVILQGSFYRYV